TLGTRIFSQRCIWHDWLSRACGALIPCAPFDHGGNSRANIAFEYRRTMDQASFHLLLLLPRQVGCKLNDLGVGRSTVPETLIALRVRRAAAACHRNNDANLAKSVSLRVINRTQADNFYLAMNRFAACGDPRAEKGQRIAKMTIGFVSRGSRSGRGQ